MEAKIIENSEKKQIQKEIHESLSDSMKNEIPTDKIIFFKTVDSTNVYAKSLFEKQNPEKLRNTVIVAESQTAGKGRLGRTFYSPKGSGVYMSIIYVPEKNITDPAKITAFTAVAVKRIIKKFFNVDSRIKWINDLYFNGKKIAGILTEGIMNYETGKIDAAVIGIGINLTCDENSFPKEMASVIGAVTDKKTDQTTKNHFIGEIVNEVLNIFNEKHTEIIAEYKNDSFLLGTEIQVHPVIGDDKTVYEALAVDIDENAGLVVKLRDGSLKTLFSGEVSLHKEL